MKYKNANIEECNNIYKKAIKEAGADNKGIFIHGNSGLGKTYFCHAVANGKKEKVENFVELLYELRDNIPKGFYNDAIKNLCDREYLIIDDIGAEKLSDSVSELVYMIVNKRYENMKKTILTTNLPFDKFSERYGDRILSRIAEMCVMVEVTGEDKRLFKEDEKKIGPITSYKDN